MHEFRLRNDPPSILLLDIILTHVCGALHEKLMNISVEKGALLLKPPHHFQGILFQNQIETHQRLCPFVKFD